MSLRSVSRRPHGEPGRANPQTGPESLSRRPETTPPGYEGVGFGGAKRTPFKHRMRDRRVMNPTGRRFSSISGRDNLSTISRIRGCCSQPGTPEHAAGWLVRDLHVVHRKASPSRALECLGEFREYPHPAAPLVCHESG